MCRALALLLCASLIGAPARAVQHGRPSGTPSNPATPVPPVSPPSAPLSAGLTPGPAPALPLPVLSPEEVALVEQAGLAQAAAMGPPDAPEPLGARVQRISEAAAEEGRAATDRDAYAGEASEAADRQFSLLLGESPRSARALAETTGAAARQVHAAMFRALAPFFPEGPHLRARGSTTRLTNAYPESDHDFTVAVPETWSEQSLIHFLARRGRLRELQAALKAELGPLAEALSPGSRVEVLVSPRKNMTRPAGVAGKVQADPSAYLLTGEAVDKETGARILKVDLLFTNNPAYLNDYPERFADQLSAAGGPEAQERMLSDIRQGKRLFKEAVGHYKSYEGGPSGVGVEQMVLRSGGLEPMLLRVLRAARAPSGRLRKHEEALAAWAVDNEFIPPPANFLALLSRKAWKRLTMAAERYFALKTAGLPFRVADLRPDPDARPQSRLSGPLAGLLGGGTPASADSSEPGALTRELLERFTASGPRPAERGEAFYLAQGARILPELLDAPDAELVLPPDPQRRSGSLRGFLIRWPDGGSAIKPSGDPDARPVSVPPSWARGAPGGTLLDVRFAKDSVRVRRVGARPQDMLVGRVAKGRDGPVLKPLLSQRGRPLSLYGDLPVSDSEVALAEGRVVQAFVHQEDGALSAVALADLGEDATPEAAAREIALRRGARGYAPRAVIEQAESRVRSDDPEAEFERWRASAREAGVPEPVDRRGRPVITIDPPGAGDLDDAYDIEKHADGSWTWTLYTAVIGHYVPPGTPGFSEAARSGNTFYSIDKHGIPEYPMNHPAVSKHSASLLPGKDSLAMVTTMRFDKDGVPLPEESGVGLGIVRVQGRYTYEQVRDYWKGASGHGVGHLEQVDLARELAAKLRARDQRRGKLDFDFAKPVHRKSADGEWRLAVEEKDPLLNESHELIEQLKVYGNRVIAPVLEEITKKDKVPHLSRVHPPQDEKKNAQLRRQLAQMGLPWQHKEQLGDYLERIKTTPGIDERRRQTAMLIALRTRNPAVYAVLDSDGHEGLALKPGEYDHPSAGIRRFADMYNLVLLDARLRGTGVRRAYEAVMDDLKGLGFADLGEFAAHLNERARAAEEMEREVDRFMAVHELAKPAYRGRALTGYVKMTVRTGESRALIQLDEPYVTVAVEGPRAHGLALAQSVTVTVTGADPADMRVDFELGR